MKGAGKKSAGKNVFPVADYRLATRDEKYWQKLARMTPEEKVLWADRTREMVLALREAADKCKKNTPS